MEGKRIHYVIVAKKTGQPYVHSGSLATDDEDAVRKHYAARGHEVVLRTCDIEEARRREAEIRGRFRLKAPTIAISPRVERDEVLHVPANEEIILIGNLHETDNDNRMVEIEWRGRRLQMFSIDFLERSEPFMKEPCHERERLISRLESAHRRIASIHNLAVEALVRGDFAAGGSLSTELKAEREELESISAELKTHITKHGC